MDTKGSGANNKEVFEFLYVNKKITDIEIENFLKESN